VELNLKEPVMTRYGNRVKIYECFNGYCNGAYLDDTNDKWVPVSWTMPNGFYLNEHHPRGIDLINDEPYTEDEIDFA